MLRFLDFTLSQEPITHHHQWALGLTHLSSPLLGGGHNDVSLSYHSQSTVPQNLDKFPQQD